jgi:hypothetical protein
LDALWECAKDKKSYNDFTMIAVKVLEAHDLSPKSKVIKREETVSVGFMLIFVLSFLLFILTLLPYFRSM